MRIIFAALLLLSTSLGGATAGTAQVGRALIGSALGVGGGAVITLSAVVARARFQQEYLDSMGDLIHWQSIPMIAAPATGIAFGIAGEEPLKGSIVGSVGGMAVGAAVGAGVGWLTTSQRQGPWAGGVIGAGIGLALGGLWGGIRGWPDDDSPGEAQNGPVIEVRIPLSGGWP